MEFNQLSKKSKEVAIKNARNAFAESIGDSCNEEVSEYVDSILAKDLSDHGIGLEVLSYRKGVKEYDYGYSGFYSQGDGFHFCTNWFEPWQFIRKEKLGKKYAKLVNANKKIDCNVGGIINRKNNGSHYQHENTVELDTVIQIDRNEQAPASYNIKEIESQAQDVLDEMFEFCQDKMRETYKWARENYEANMSDEYIEDFILGNDIEFAKDGDIE